MLAKFLQNLSLCSSLSIPSVPIWQDIRRGGQSPGFMVYLNTIEVLCKEYCQTMCGAHSLHSYTHYDTTKRKDEGEMIDGYHNWIHDDIWTILLLDWSPPLILLSFSMYGSNPICYLACCISTPASVWTWLSHLLDRMMWVMFTLAF